MQSELRLLTFNVHMLTPFASVQRAAAVARAVNERGYDVVCLQEVFDEDARAIFVRDLAGSFLHLVPEAGGAGWRDDSGLFFASQSPLLTSAFQPYSFPIPTPGFDFLATKGALGVHLRHGVDGSSCDLLVFDTHLDSVLASTRRQQLVRLRDFMAETVSQLPDPARTAVLIAGDMNVRGENGQGEYLQMLSLLGEPRDLYVEAGNGDDGCTHPVSDPRRRLDYWLALDSIVLNGEPQPLAPVQVVSVRVAPFDDRELSDHLPVEVVIRIAEC
jgi:endonuclease/exonuclease/phosphatase family metal-dependent hydrolase